jgi:cytochrome c553
MKSVKSIAAFSVAGLLLAASAMAQNAAPPEPDIVADTCSVCHGEDGISPRARFPNLAGQTKEYLDAQLKNFQNHKRADPDAVAYMWRQAGALSGKTVNEIAAYYSALPPAKDSAGESAARVAAGKQIYEHGIESENVPACGACHGAMGAGMAAFPRIAGQHPEYVVAQLQAFRSKARDNAIMYANVQHMTDDQMRDVAAYLASL